MFAFRRYIFAFNVFDNDYFDGLNEICENMLHFALLFHPNNYFCFIFFFNLSNCFGQRQILTIVFIGILTLQHVFLMRQTWLFFLLSLKFEKNSETLRFFSAKRCEKTHQSESRYSINIYMGTILHRFHTFFMFSTSFLISAKLT